MWNNKAETIVYYLFTITVTVYSYTKTGQKKTNCQGNHSYCLNKICIQGERAMLLLHLWKTQKFSAYNLTNNGTKTRKVNIERKSIEQERSQKIKNKTKRIICNYNKDNTSTYHSIHFPLIFSFHHDNR